MATLVIADPGLAENLWRRGYSGRFSCRELSPGAKTAATVRMVMSRALSFMADPARGLGVPARGRGSPSSSSCAALTVYMIAEAVTEGAGRAAVRRDGR
jgi:hypothetical protein